MKIAKKICAALLMLSLCLYSVSLFAGVEARAAAKLEYIPMSEEVRASVAAYAKTYAANKASSSASVLTSNRNTMMPVRSSGNCATFVSSSLAYAGIPYDSQGGNQWQAEVTLSFASTSGIGAYLQNNSGEGNGIKAKKIKSGVNIPSMSASDWSSLKVGDVVCMTMSGGGGHTVVIVEEGNSMETVFLASHTRDGVYDFKFWKSAVSKMDIYRIEGFYRTASASGSGRAIHKTGQNGQSQQIAYLKNKSTGVALTTQGYEESATGNVAYSLRTDRYYPGLDTFSASSEGIKTQSKRIMRLGLAHSDDSLALFNAKLGLSGSGTLKNKTEAVSATQLAVWVAQGQLSLGNYTTMGTAGERVLAVANMLLTKTKDVLSTQAALKLTGTTGIKLAQKEKGGLAGPFKANTSWAYTVVMTGASSGVYSCTSGGEKKSDFGAGEGFYLMVPSQKDGTPFGVRIQSSAGKAEYSSWQAGSTQPLGLVEISRGPQLGFGVTMNLSKKSVTVGEEPAGIQLHDGTLSLYAGETHTLNATRHGGAAGKTIAWSSSDPKTVTVSQKGVVTAKGVGTATITATVAGASDQCTVTVEETPKGIALRVDSKKAIVDGRTTTIDENGSYPFISNGRTLVPVRFTSEKMGAKVKWKSNEAPITISNGNCVVTLTVGSRTITVQSGGETVQKTIDQEALLKNGRVYVPLRAVAENLGLSVKYDDSSRIIVMTENRLSSNELATRVRAAAEVL